MLRLIKMDLSRYTGDLWNPFAFFSTMFIHPGMFMSIIYRFERYLIYESNALFKVVGFFFYPLYYFISYYCLSYKINPKVKIGGGLFLHNREIIMTENISIGKYFTCMGQTTIGKHIEKELGSLTIGDNVTLGVGAKIVAKGKMFIADNITIGANGVVTKSLEKKYGVYVGIPVKLIKTKPKK